MYSVWYDKVKNTQISIERTILDIILKTDKTWIREQTKIRDIIEVNKRQNWTWVVLITKRKR